MDEPNAYYKISKKHLVICIVILNLYPMYLAISAFVEIPRYEQLLVDLFEGEKIPMITSVMLATYKYLWLIPLILISISLALLEIKPESPLLPTALAIITLLTSLLMQIFLFHGKTEPMVRLIQKLGG